MNVATFRRLNRAVRTKPKIRLPKLAGPNKTEHAWMQECYLRHPGCAVLFEPCTLHLPSGTRYTPDVLVLDGRDVVAFYEVKGTHIHSTASLRAFKEARAAFNFWRFIFAQKFSTGWTTAE